MIKGKEKTGNHWSDCAVHNMPAMPAGPCDCDTNAPGQVSGAEALAMRFHEKYERLAPVHGYETQKSSSVAWNDVPDNNKQLMIAVCVELLSEGV